MSDNTNQVRRATVDDLEPLRALWIAMRLPAVELEKRLTEFQVVLGPDGSLLGGVAMELSGRTGRLHSEVFKDFALAEELRQLLWQRLQAVINNHGLARIWTRETAPFWKSCGFQPPEEPALKKLPAAWAGDGAPWLTLRVRDEEVLEGVLDKEFARFKAEEERDRQRILAPGRHIKNVATILAVILAIVVAFLLLRMLMNQAGLPAR